MRALVVTIIVLASGLSGCTRDPVSHGSTRVAAEGVVAASASLAPHAATLRLAAFASLPDRGELVRYDPAVPPVSRSAYTWHAIELSEAYAMRSTVEGELAITRPDGQLLRLRYDRHIEHPDGNWTWVGRPEGAQPGTEAIITFGDRAVFGTIPDGDRPPLRLTTLNGRAWLMETDAAAVSRLAGAHPRGPDFLVPPATAQRAHAPTASGTAAGQMAVVADASAAGNTVDVLLGYTSNFASRLGGQSQANTRLTFLVDVANQAYANSQVAARLRLVKTVQVSYPDATGNDTALYELTGVACTEQPDGSLDCNDAPVPTSLQPLLAAREQYGADTVSLVRNFNSPENGSCGIAWLIGGGQVSITSSDEYAAMSVVSDSNGMGVESFPDNGFACRDETLAHEVGHNMGLAHDRDTADGDDNVLQTVEYGRYPYSFGYKTDTSHGNFFTVMAYGDSGQTPYRVFSNPQITYCGGRACGVTDQADSARTLRQTVPIVATFRASAVGAAGSDFNGDGRSDVLWHNGGTGASVIWRSANSGTPQAVSSVSTAWRVAGIGDLDGDGVSDILWRNASDGRNAAWRSGNSATQVSISTVASQAWKVSAVADFDGDGRADILWHNAATGANAIWKSGDSTTQQPIAAITNLDWVVAGAGDFDGDGKADILWRNGRTGANTIWRSGSASTPRSMASVTNLAWKASGIGDFDGDGKDDVLWHNDSTGASSVWKSASASTPMAVATLKDARWRVAAIADYNGDGRSDIFWRHSGNGSNTIWRSANASTSQAVATVSSLSWAVAR